MALLAIFGIENDGLNLAVNLLLLFLVVVWLALVWLDRSPGRLRLAGLDPATTYRLELVGPRPADGSAATTGWPAGSSAHTC